MKVLHFLWKFCWFDWKRINFYIRKIVHFLPPAYSSVRYSTLLVKNRKSYATLLLDKFCLPTSEPEWRVLPTFCRSPNIPTIWSPFRLVGTIPVCCGSRTIWHGFVISTDLDPWIRIQRLWDPNQIYCPTHKWYDLRSQYFSCGTRYQLLR